MSMTKDKITDQEPFEDVLARLEQNVQALESGEVSLEKALELFEEGIRLSRELNSRLAAAEEKIKELTRDSSGDLKLNDFEEAENDE
jgi:exodeoxyribonuclease VII small subunit